MWLKRILIGLGIAVALVIAIVLVVGYWAPSGEVSKTTSVDVGDHTVTIGGKYRNVTQESMADGMDIKVDGHEIAINADQLTVDGKTQVLEAGRQDPRELVEQRRPGVSGLAREALLQGLLERPGQCPRHHAVVAHSDAKLAMAGAEQLERGSQSIVVTERDHGELHRGPEFAALRLRRADEPCA